jgi:hypothetical protein
MGATVSNILKKSSRIKPILSDSNIKDQVSASEAEHLLSFTSTIN